MRASGVKRLKEIEGKHPKLKRIYAHLAMENEALKERINRCYRREVFDAYFFGITRRSARDHSSLDDFLQRIASPSITRKPALSILPPTTDPDQNQRFSVKNSIFKYPFGGEAYRRGNIGCGNLHSRRNQTATMFWMIDLF